MEIKTKYLILLLRYFVVLSFGVTLDLALSGVLNPSKNPHLVSFWRFLKVLLLLWCPPYIVSSDTRLLGGRLVIVGHGERLAVSGSIDENYLLF